MNASVMPMSDHVYDVDCADGDVTAGPVGRSHDGQRFAAQSRRERGGTIRDVSVAH